MIPSYTVASKAAGVRRCRSERVFTPRLADLFEALGVISAATHSVKILRNKRMTIVGLGNPIHVLGPLVTGVSAQREADLAVDGATVGLLQANQLAHDDIRARNGPNAWLVQRWQ